MTIDRTKGVQPVRKNGFSGSSAHCRRGIGRQDEEGVPSRLFVCLQSNTRRPLERPRRCDSPSLPPRPGTARAPCGASEPSPDCIDSPHGWSVSSRVSPDDPRFDPRPVSARRDLEGRSSAGSSPDSLASLEPGATRAIDFMRLRGLSSISHREKDFSGPERHRDPRCGLPEIRPAPPTPEWPKQRSEDPPR